MRIRKGRDEDIEETAGLYDALIDYLEGHVNYPGWKKGIYPTRYEAELGIEEDSLYVATVDDRIVGTFILRHRQEEGYAKADWKSETEENRIWVLYTFAVHPHDLHHGIGKQILEYVLLQARRENIQEIRLDVYENNMPAIHLYEQMGFRYVDTVDLGYGMYGLNRFCLYHYLIRE